MMDRILLGTGIDAKLHVQAQLLFLESADAQGYQIYLNSQEEGMLVWNLQV
jgi:hypothetical protein